MSTKQIMKIMAGSASAVLLASSLAACGSAGGSTTKNGAASTTGLVTQSGAGARLSGINQASMFVGWIDPTSMYPSDVTMQNPDEFDTGELITSNAKYAWPKLSCSDAAGHASGPGFGEVAYELNEGDNTSTKDQYSYSVYEFSSADQASQFVTQAAAKLGSCGSFTLSSDGVSLSVSLSLGPKSEAAAVASANVAVDVREDVTAGGKEVAGELLFAADGNIAVVVSSAREGTSIPTEVSSAQIAQEIFAALAAGEQQASQTVSVGGASPAEGAGGVSSAPAVSAGDRAGGAR